MNCERAKKMLVEYSEGVLAESKRSAVESHLAGCEACRGELSQIERLKGSLLSLDVPERDAEFAALLDQPVHTRASGQGACDGQLARWFATEFFGREDFQSCFTPTAGDETGRGLAPFPVEQDHFFACPHANDVEQMMRFVAA